MRQAAGDHDRVAGTDLPAQGSPGPDGKGIAYVRPDEIILRDAGAPGAPALAPPMDAPVTGLAAILRLLQRRGKHDFTLYKHSTLLRRIERRMGIHRLPTMDAYAAMLEGNEQELDLLFKELLIGVTAFFRDTPVWQALQTESLPRLLAERGPGHHLRAWVVGCSTGEEAYTIDQWRADAASGKLKEAFACGTAAVISPIGKVRSASGDFTINGGNAGPVAMGLRKQLVDIQYGRAADPHNWVRKVF